jgi:predicted  nucleic acid-binding Zn-ribbon protein
LTEANTQIVQQSNRIRQLNDDLMQVRSKYDALWDSLQDERAQWASERAQLRERFEVAVIYIRKLLTIMQECNIVAPALPAELETHIKEDGK